MALAETLIADGDGDDYGYTDAGVLEAELWANAPAGSRRVIELSRGVHLVEQSIDQMNRHDLRIPTGHLMIVREIPRFEP